jgi:hypothetical protein
MFQAMTKSLDDLYVFVESEYSATGEGLSVALLITRAYPRKEDYEVEPEWIYTDGKCAFQPGVMKNGPGFRALREFAEVHGVFIARGARLYTYEEFMKRRAAYIPRVVENLLKDPEQPGNFNWYTQIHFNFG